MAGIGTAPGVDRRPLISYLRVQKETDQAVLSHLRSSAASIDRELRRLENRTGIGALVRSAQLRTAQASIQQEMSRLWGNIGDTVEAQKALAAAAAASGPITDSSILAAVFPAADRSYMARSAQLTATRGLEALERRIEGTSYVPLAESVYNNAALSAGKVDELVNSALARGASAAELARDVRGYVNPNTPGGVRYAAMRLGRTELNNSFHASQVKQGIQTPWTTGLRWNLSGSHPRPDECNEYAESSHYDGGDAGVFLPEEVPAKPHPNCLCFTTPETPDRDAFVNQFMAGEYDDHIATEFGLSAEEATRALPFKAVNDYAWGYDANGVPHYGVINDALRNGKPVPATSTPVMTGLDKAFTLAEPLKTDLRVSRQMGSSAANAELKRLAQQGGVFTERGYMSTTTNQDILPDFLTADEGFILDIHAPAGTRALHVDDFTDSEMFKQDEWLFPRNSRLQLSNLRWDPDAESWRATARLLREGETIRPLPVAVSSASRVEQLETLIKREQARGRANPRLRSATQANIRKARIELQKLRRR